MAQQNGSLQVTGSVFKDLAIAMMSFGAVVGVVFPFAIMVLGVPREIAMAPPFIGACITAGLLVGAANIAIANRVVKPRIRALAEGMGKVEAGIAEATYTGDWSRCDPESCRIPVDSSDDIGAASEAFNRLVFALWRSHDVGQRVGAFTEAMTTQLELKTLAADAISGLLGATEAQAAAILGDAGGELEVLGSHGLVESEFLRENDHVRLALKTREPSTVEIPDDVAVHAGLVAFQPREVRFEPLSMHGQAIGVVVLASGRPFSPAQRSLSTVMVRSLSVALSNAMTHDKLQRIAALDALTGIYNRRFGLTRLREEFGRAQRNDTPIALAVFDIDHFKSVNDTYGHLVGDRVIIAVAKLAQSRLREGDVVLRYGGEEFVVVLPGASTSDVGEVCERIRRAVEEHVVHDGEQAIRFTVSLGYASTGSVQVEDETALLDLADQALYRAKQSGRNKALPAT